MFRIPSVQGCGQGHSATDDRGAHANHRSDRQSACSLQSPRELVQILSKYVGKGRQQPPFFFSLEVYEVEQDKIDRILANLILDVADKVMAARQTAVWAVKLMQLMQNPDIDQTELAKSIWQLGNVQGKEKRTMGSLVVQCAMDDLEYKDIARKLVADAIQGPWTTVCEACTSPSFSFIVARLTQVMPLQSIDYIAAALWEEQVRRSTRRNMLRSRIGTGIATSKKSDEDLAKNLFCYKVLQELFSQARRFVGKWQHSLGGEVIIEQLRIKCDGNTVKKSILPKHQKKRNGVDALVIENPHSPVSRGQNGGRDHIPLHQFIMDNRIQYHADIGELKENVIYWNSGEKWTRLEDTENIYDDAQKKIHALAMLVAENAHDLAVHRTGNFVVSAAADLSCEEVKEKIAQNLAKQIPEEKEITVAAKNIAMHENATYVVQAAITAILYDKCDNKRESVCCHQHTLLRKVKAFARANKETNKGSFLDKAVKYHDAKVQASRFVGTWKGAVCKNRATIVFDGDSLTIHYPVEATGRTYSYKASLKSDSNGAEGRKDAVYVTMDGIPQSVVGSLEGQDAIQWGIKWGKWTRLTVRASEERCSDGEQYQDGHQAHEEQVAPTAQQCEGGAAPVIDFNRAPAPIAGGSFAPGWVPVMSMISQPMVVPQGTQVPQGQGCPVLFGWAPVMSMANQPMCNYLCYYQVPQGQGCPIMMPCLVPAMFLPVARARYLPSSGP